MTGDSVEVRTAQGRVRGEWGEGLAVFRGISYARPPVGALRFAAPEAPEAWDGVREAVRFGPPPPQSGPFRVTEGRDGTDWLTLNVWSPDPGGPGLPVLVWIPGGGYISGYSGDPMYEATPLARHSGLVVVTLNYRLGAEGFAELPGAPSNRGLLDQIAALRWVRENIGRFGGDPDRVTVFGQSAGAGSIATLMAAPAADGLFRRAVTQSVPGLYATPALAAGIAGSLAARLGAEPTVAGLGAIDPWRLADAIGPLMDELPAREDVWGHLARTGVAFCPVVDGDVVPDVPWRTLRDGRASGIDLLTGHTRDEFRPFLVATGRQVTEEEAGAALRAFAPRPDGERAYRAAYPDAPPARLFDHVHSDVLFRIPSVHLADAHSAGGGTAHLYELCWPAPAQGGALGSGHGLDVHLLFGNYASPAAALYFPEGTPPDEALAVGDEIRRSWTSFAAHGDPGWPPYRATEGRLTRLFDATTRTAPYPEEPSRRVWEGHGVAPYDLP
ncbi:carboxylesterase/lipase family protein [Streptomyces griseocarneus]|uniref:carboxylesterase/lipase family protein n=1 Tax=Streptomyces griseocarneus TaxID=51201 RepID=UPI00167CB82D|nr:carboxylesterase family protein [Streptomyces griseocarneus]MBZ6474209.1 carboxylesterase family protein [Streptomyces griseocarneus]GHG52615.1 carboxylic ester hydrolase [Streptomyces griseocarneus]